MRQRAHALQAMLDERLAEQRVAGCWLLRPGGETSIAAALRGTRLATWLGKALAGYGLHYALLGLAWYAVGQGALFGRVDAGWLAAWFLALASSVPVQAAVAMHCAQFSIDAGAWLRTRLLDSILRLDPELVRRQGSGRLLVTVLEAGVLETLGLSGGLVVMFAMIDLVVASIVVTHAAGGGMLAALWLLTLGVAGVATTRYLGLRRRWTARRLDLTQELIERMLGHRTRLAQEPLAQRHSREDELLDHYLDASLRLDRLSVFVGMLPRFGLLAAAGCLALQLMAAAPSHLQLALALGGMLLSTRALGALLSGLHQLAATAIAFEYVAPLLRAAKPSAPAHPLSLCAAHSGTQRSALEARGLTLRHPTTHEPILGGVDLTIEAGEHILLEGNSGSGKSTFAHVLAGLRPLERGLLSFNGFDRATLGARGWSRRVTVAPQFHDNHVVSGSLLFNTLLGRAWPPAPGDLRLAESMCRELGLGPLIDRMPAGMHQILGETGWQLSHGEKSRLYAARAVLCDADLVVFDESIAALDPETAQVVLRCARRHARSLMLIAHP